jgi:hypothetical protein
VFPRLAGVQHQRRDVRLARLAVPADCSAGRVAARSRRYRDQPRGGPGLAETRPSATQLAEDELRLVDVRGTTARRVAIRPRLAALLDPRMTPLVEWPRPREARPGGAITAGVSDQGVPPRGMQLREAAGAGDEVARGAILDDDPVFHHQYAVRDRNRRQAVRDDDRRAVGQQGL